MNIQQINGSGHNIWLFAITSVVALLITGVVWYSIEEINNIRIFYRDRRKAPRYGLAYRIYMLGWVVVNGGFPWLRQTGAWSQILSNSKNDFLPALKYKLPHGNPETPFRTACHYVAFFMSLPLWKPCDPFALDDITSLSS